MLIESSGPELNIQGILESAFGSPDEAASPAVVQHDIEGQQLLQLAPNAIEWCVAREWCNSGSLYDFWRSYQIIRDYFELRCPLCNQGGTGTGQPGDCWNRSKAYLEDEVLLRFSVDHYEDVCPKCRTTRSEFIEDGFFSGYNQLHLIAGMRSGKSMTAALIGTYVEHVHYVIGHTFPGGIHAYFGITPAELFEMTFLASNQVQSEGTIWAKYTGFRTNSPWFRRYVSWIDEQRRNQPRSRMRPWTYIEDAKSITNGHPNVRLEINALNSNSSGQAGRTRIHGFVDEMARMKQTVSAFGAAEIYRTIEASLRTIRSRTKLYGAFPWFGSMFSVTSPIARHDAAMKLYQKAAADEIPGMYSKKYATWDFNPLEPRSNFDAEFAKDEVGARRDFGADPPGAEYPLIEDEPRWYALSVNPKAKPTAQFDYYNRRDPTGQEYVGVRLRKSERMFDKRMPRFLVFDAGKNFDCFTGVCAHGEWIPYKTERHNPHEPDVREESRDMLVTVYDWMIRIIPSQHTEVWFESVYELVRELKAFQSMALVVFDQWNSVQLIQKIRDLGIPAEQDSLKKDDFRDFRVNCMEQRVRMMPPAVEDVKLSEETGEIEVPLEWKKRQSQMQAQSAAIAELLELQCDPDTYEVYNPNKGEIRGEHSDDAARIIVHAHKLVQNAGFTEKYDDRSTRAARRRAEYESAKWGPTRGGLAGGTRGAGSHTQKRGW